MATWRWALLIACLCCACGGDGESAPDDACVTVCSPVDAEAGAARDAASLVDAAVDAGPTQPDAARDAGPGSDAGCMTLCGVARAGATQSFAGCTYASPLAYGEGDSTEVWVAASETLIAFSLEGSELWRLTLPAPEGEMAFVVATPVRIGDRLVVGYHTVVRTDEPHDVNRARVRHRMAVVDLAARSLDAEFETFDLAAEFEGNDGLPVAFDPATALGRAELAHVTAEDGLGKVYVAFGNARDIQPWHGFLFEVDLDAWREQGGDAAISASFISTPESECGTPGTSGSRSRLCGGGMWSPSGPTVIERAEGRSAEIIVSTGNGQLDLARDDFSNALLRFSPGLAFDPGCDAAACADFDPDAPSAQCLESCEHLFVPRESPGDPFPAPESGKCDGLTLFECWEELDYVGGSSPAHVELEDGRAALAYPAKDGALYLIDTDHLGRMHDRKQLVPVCGTDEDPCMQDWAGMIVTEPAVAGSLLLVPTFMPDRTHPAGVVAVEITGELKLEVKWQAPGFDTHQAVERFRRHPSRITLSHEGRVAWLVETAAKGGKGRLLGLRVSDGAIVVDEPLRGPGYRFTQPLLVGERLFVPSCEPDNGPSTLEIFEVGAAL